jgi:hypothetical protein
VFVADGAGEVDVAVGGTFVLVGVFVRVLVLVGVFVRVLVLVGTSVLVGVIVFVDVGRSVGEGGAWNAGPFSETGFIRSEGAATNAATAAVRVTRTIAYESARLAGCFIWIPR